jgi:hypothetical protein
MGRRPATGRLSTREELKRCIASHNLPPDRRPCCTVLNRVWWPACPVEPARSPCRPIFPAVLGGFLPAFSIQTPGGSVRAKVHSAAQLFPELGRSVTIVSVIENGGHALYQSGRIRTLSRCARSSKPKSRQPICGWRLTSSTARSTTRPHAHSSEAEDEPCDALSDTDRTATETR